jgi:MFS family permease
MTEVRAPKAATRISADLVITVVLVVVFAAALLATTGWMFRTALFPMIVSGTALLLGLSHLATLLLSRSRRHDADEPESPGPTAIVIEADDADHDADYVFATAGRRAWIGALAWIGAFFLGLYVLGLIIAAPLFSLCYMRFSARWSWLLSIVYALVVLVAIYLAFEGVLTIPIPSAVWEQS